MMLLQDALTSAQSEAGESFRGIEIGSCVSEDLVFAGSEAGVGNIDDGDAVFGLRGDGESSAAVLADGMQAHR